MADSSGSGGTLSPDDFSCAICLELLHKPCVNRCGHAFCFWCFHQAMGLSASHWCADCTLECADVA